VLVVGAQDQPTRMAALRDAGAELLLLPDADGHVDLPGLLQRLAGDGVNELHVEAGAVLNGALLNAGLVDELLVYTAPKLLGPGLDMATLPALPALDAALAFSFEDCQRVGDDLRLLVRRSGAADFLKTPAGGTGA
jgi:diaminohydroxyphosphoribosylaminopyrimidine deaminase/5-amino-6-(5-phosphoribosylamino)uracil reductase